MLSWGYFLKSILQQFQCTCSLMQNVLQYCVPVFITVVNLIFLIDLVFKYKFKSQANFPL